MEKVNLKKHVLYIFFIKLIFFELFAQNLLQTVTELESCQFILLIEKY